MHFLARELFKKDGRNGTNFYSSLAIPPVIKGNLLQRILIDGGQKIPPLKDLRLTYGNRIAMARRYEHDEVFDIICPEDFTSSSEHLIALEKEFELLNDPAKSFKQRLDLWNHSQPGFIMALFGSDGATSGIGCLANPVCMQSETASGTFGAPVWTDTFSQQFCDEFVGVGTTASHCIVGSLCHETWSLLGSDRDAFTDGLLPVMITSGSTIGCKLLNGDVFQLIYIPFQGEAPVGFFVNLATTYDEYVAGFTSTIAYKNFIHLLKKFRSTYFEPWFNRVNANPTAFAVPLKPADALWDKFPTMANPDGTDLEDPSLLEPFLVQYNRFHRAALDDMILRAPCGAQPADETIVRCQYNCWRQLVAECYPTELGTQRPVARQAFLEQLLPPQGGWSPNYCAWFSVCDLDPVISLPPSYAKYTPMPVPTTAEVQDGWQSRRLDEPVATANPLAAFRKAAKARRDQAKKPPSPTPLSTQADQTTTPAPPLVQDATGQASTPSTAMAQGTSSVTVSRLGSLLNGVTPSPPDHGVQFASQSGSTTSRQDAAPTMPHPSLVKRPLSYNPFGTAGFDTASAIQLDETTPPQQKRARLLGMVPPQNLFGMDEDPTNQVPNMNHMHQSAVFSPEKTSRQTDPYGEMMMGHFQQPYIIQTTGTVSRPKYATMEASRIDTLPHRKKCNPVFLQMCLLLAFECGPGDQIYFPDRGYTAKSEDFLFVKPPSNQGVCFLAGFDHANNGVEAANAMTAAIYYRWSSDPELGMFGTPTHDWQSKITSSFVTRAYTVASWSMRTDRSPPRAADEKHSILSFLPLIDPTYSSEAIPTGGIPMHQMLQLTRFVYFFYSMPSCKPGVHGQAYDDSNFQRSIFGSVLRFMCRILLNHELMQPWEQHQEECTVAFITDFRELFELMAEFIRHGVGADPVMCGLADGAFSQRQRQIIVAPATMMPHHITSLPNHLVEKMTEYRKRMNDTWVRNRYVAHQGNKWSNPSSSFLLQQSVLQQAGSTTVDRDSEHSQGRGKKANGKTQATGGPVVTTPMFEYVGTKEFSSAKNLVPHLIKEVTKGDWPTLMIGEKRHTLCLHSSFKGFCVCDKHESCRTPRPFPGFAKTRLHVDLKDSKWPSTNFGEEKWEPVVTFLKAYHKLVKPSEALKKLTPSANWPA